MGETEEESGVQGKREMWWNLSCCPQLAQVTPFLHLSLSLDIYYEIIAYKPAVVQKIWPCALSPASRRAVMVEHHSQDTNPDEQE